MSLSQEIKMAFLLLECWLSICMKGMEATTLPTWVRRKHFSICRITKAPRRKITQVGLFFSCSAQLSGSVCVHIHVPLCALLSANMRVLECTWRSYSKGEIFDYIVFTYPSDPNDLNIEHRSRRALRSLHLQSYTV